MTHIEGGHHLPPTPVYSNAVQASAIRTLSNAKDCTYKYLKKKETQSPQQCRLSLPTPKSASSNFVQAIGELMGIMNKEFGADSEAMLNLEKGNQEQTTSLFLQNKVLKADGVKLKKAIKEKQKLEAKENESTGDKVKDFFKSPMTIIMIVTIVLTIATCGATAALSAEMIAEDVAVEGVEIGEEAGSEGAGAAGESVETASSNAEVEIQSDASTAESDAQTAQNGAKAAESGAKTYADQFPRLAKMVSYMKKLVIPLNLVSAPTYIDTFVKGVYWLNITANPSLNPDNQTKPSSGPGTKTPPPPTSPGQFTTSAVQKDLSDMKAISKGASHEVQDGKKRGDSSISHTLSKQYIHIVRDYEKHLANEVREKRRMGQFHFTQATVDTPHSWQAA